MTTSVTVQAHANIALIKYWGKRDDKLFLPTKSSLSMTLSPLTSVTTLSFCDGQHQIFFNGILKHKDITHCQIINFLEFFKKELGLNYFFSVDTRNTFPTAAGLASSASGYAALVYGLNKLCHLNLSPEQLSQYARQGSGSACRSLFGGFVLWNKGERANGSDSYAKQLFDEHHWPELRVLVAVVNAEEKEISSRQGMKIAMATSPFYQQWVVQSEQKIPLIIDAIKQKNLECVGMLAEEDCLGMHKTMHTSSPSFSFWTTDTGKVVQCVRKLRDSDIICFFTIDAGPNVKILCLQKDVAAIKKTLADAGCAKQLIECMVGSGPTIV